MTLRTFATTSFVFQAAVSLHAAVLSVTTLLDSGPGSLRDAVSLSAPGDVIQFNVTGTIVLSSSITIGKAISVLGPGPSALVVSANHVDRVFITSGNPLLLAGMTIQDGLVVGPDGLDGTFSQPNGGPGAGANGGAILNSGSLTLSNCWVTGNEARGGRGGRGFDNYLPVPVTPGNGGSGGSAGSGGIDGGVRVAVDCTFSANRAIGGDGGAGGNNLNLGMLETGGTGGTGGSGFQGVMFSDRLTNCTFSGNAALGGAGGAGGNTSAVFVGGQGGDGGSGECGAIEAYDLGYTISCTVVNNSAVGGGGGAGGSGSPPGNAGNNGSGYTGGICGYLPGPCLPSVGNTIAAENFASTLYQNLHIHIYDLGWNYLGDDVDTGSLCISSSTRMGTVALPLHPLLGALAQNGGGLPTHAPLPGSPVIDWGFSFGSTRDERGAPRPYGTPAFGSGGDGSDVGAVEFGSAVLGLSLGGNGVVVSWPAYYGDFTLQSATTLSGIGNWSDVLDPPIVVGDQFTVTNCATGASRFFRLINR